MFVISFLVGALIGGLMYYSLWADTKSLLVSTHESLPRKLQRRGMIRIFLISVMLFSIFYWGTMQGFVALLGFLISRSALLFFLNQHRPTV